MSRTMEEEDDDFYDPADVVPAAQETSEMEEEVEVEDDEVGSNTIYLWACCTDIFDRMISTLSQKHQLMRPMQKRELPRSRSDPDVC